MSTGPIPAERPSLRRRVSDALAGRVRAGVGRGRKDWLIILRAAFAASVAYMVAGLLWGHQFPFFASIAAFVIIGFSADAKVRKVMEMSCGVMMGVLLGELAHVTIGAGTWQIFVVIFCAGMLARLLDSGVMFGIQTSIQSLLVMIMPATPTMTPGGRILDAITGVSIAILVHLLLSGDPRRIQRRAAEVFFQELDDALVALALAARTGSAEVARAALVSVRKNSQKHTDEWRLANDAANEMATFSPTGLRHAADVRRMQQLLVGSDRAMRNVRVIARREVEFLSVVDGAPHARLADALLAGRDAVTAIRDGIESDVDFTAARRRLRLFTSYLTPETLLLSDEGVRPGRAGHFEGVTLVIQLRSLAIDLLEATGLPHKDAKQFLPSLLVAADGDTVGPRPMTREMQAVEPPATTEALELLIADRSDPDRRR